jgi:metal-responsive CopG/Arc/MetJ family transcriptional regulator
MRKFTCMGLSLPNELAQKIEKDRGDINRSRYLLRIIENFYQNQNNQKSGQLRAGQQIQTQTITSMNGDSEHDQEEFRPTYQ